MSMNSKCLLIRHVRVNTDCSRRRQGAIADIYELMILIQTDSYSTLVHEAGQGMAGLGAEGILNGKRCREVVITTPFAHKTSQVFLSSVE